MRIDKWLWAARFFRTRTLARQGVDGGRVKVNGDRVKPSRDLKAGDRLVIHIGAYEWAIRVVRLADQRGPVDVARTLYEEDGESRARRVEQVALRRLAPDPGRGRQGRPSKRERRQLERWREGR